MVPEGWIIEGGGHNGQYFNRNLFITEDKIPQLRDKYDNTDVYTTALCYDSNTQSTATKYGPFYTDFDHKDFEVARRDAIKVICYINSIYGISEDDMEIYFSGSKGVHVVIAPEIMGIVPHIDLNNIYRLIAEDLVPLTTEYEVSGKKRRTLDLAIYDCRRLFRLPNSINRKSGLYKIPITYQELTSLSESEIRKMAEQPRELNRQISTACVPKAKKIVANFINRWETRSTKKTFTGDSFGKLRNYEAPPCITYLLDNPTAEGSRNETAVVLASFYNQKGMQHDDALLALSEWSEKRCDPPMDRHELEMVINSAYKKGYHFGCNGVKRVSECDKSRCNLVRR